MTDANSEMIRLSDSLRIETQARNEAEDEIERLTLERDDARSRQCAQLKATVAQRDQLNSDLAAAKAQLAEAEVVRAQRDDLLQEQAGSAASAVYHDSLVAQITKLKVDLAAAKGIHAKDVARLVGERDAANERAEHQWDGWQPTSEAINALPKPLRDFVHGLEANCDPAGIIAQNTILLDRAAQLETALAAANKRAEVDSLKAVHDDYAKHTERAQKMLKPKHLGKNYLQAALDQLDEVHAVLRDYPSGQDDGTWLKRREAAL